MNKEVESVYFNSPWKLVDPPEDVRPIGAKRNLLEEERSR